MSDGSCVWQAKIKPTAVGEKRTSLDRRVAEEAETQGTACTCTGNNAGGIASKRGQSLPKLRPQLLRREKPSTPVRVAYDACSTARWREKVGGRARHIHTMSRREGLGSRDARQPYHANRTGAAARATRDHAHGSCLQRRAAHDVEDWKHILYSTHGAQSTDVRAAGRSERGNGSMPMCSPAAVYQSVSEMTPKTQAWRLRNK